MALAHLFSFSLNYLFVLSSTEWACPSTASGHANQAILDQSSWLTRCSKNLLFPFIFDYLNFAEEFKTCSILQEAPFQPHWPILQ
jgi:hypothetical protein